MGRISDLLVSLIFFMLILSEGGRKMFNLGLPPGWKLHLLGRADFSDDGYMIHGNGGDDVRYDPF